MPGLNIIRTWLQGFHLLVTPYRSLVDFSILLAGLLTYVLLCFWSMNSEEIVTLVIRRPSSSTLPVWGAFPLISITYLASRDGPKDPPRKAPPHPPPDLLLSLPSWVSHFQPPAYKADERCSFDDDWKNYYGSTQNPTYDVVATGMSNGLSHTDDGKCRPCSKW